MVEDKQAFVSFILCLFLAVVLNCQLIKRKTKNDVCFLMTLYLLRCNSFLWDSLEFVSFMTMDDRNRR